MSWEDNAVQGGSPGKVSYISRDAVDDFFPKFAEAYRKDIRERKERKANEAKKPLPKKMLILETKVDKI